MLQIPTRIRSISIPRPEGSPLASLPCVTKRTLGSVSTPLCSIVGLELSVAPRQAEPANTRCSICQHSAAQLSLPPSSCHLNVSSFRETNSHACCKAGPEG